MRKTEKMIAALAVAAAGCFSLATGISVAYAKAEAGADTGVPAKAIEEVSFTMGRGASARIADDGHNGLRFTASMTKADYEGLTANTAYSAFSFGMLIAPADWLTQGNELTKDNVFGAEAVYTWAGKGDASPSAKTIINLSADTLALSEDGTYYYLNGSITDLLSANIAREFVGLGYIGYTTGGVADYKMAEYDGADIANNTRSMTYVAQKALEDKNSALTDAQKAKLKESYIDPLADKTFTYTVNHHKGNTVETETKSAALGAEATAEAKLYTDYEYDPENAGNVLSGTVYANGKTTLECYYTERATANDMLNVKGGVLLNRDGSIIFPESHNGVNGVGDEQNYQDNDYSANLKETVRGDFSIEFTVSDYKVKAGVDYPKLMISLGGSHNQFYVVYNREGHVNWVESFTNTLNDNKEYWTGGSWCNSDEFAAGFDTTAAHTYKIEVVGGMYSVSLDGTKLFFSADDTTHQMMRLYNDYIHEMPIRISTNGVSCKVSEIKVLDTAEETFTYGEYVTGGTANGFTMKFGNRGWSSRDKYTNRITFTNSLPENFTLTYDLVFSNNMDDAKFVTTIGGREGKYHFMINNKGSHNTINGNIYNRPNDDGWEATDVAYALTMKVKIVRKDGKLQFFINDTQIQPQQNLDTVTDSTLEFYAFNGKSEEANYTATVSNLTIA